MNLPSQNPGGYINASISDVTGFHNIDFLLAHGSGDDNVHYANSAHLLDMFTAAQVRNFRFRMFTDRYVGGCRCYRTCRVTAELGLLSPRSIVITVLTPGVLIVRFMSF